jgi:TolB-like protein/Flp pilus assembly protein TadD
MGLVSELRRRNVLRMAVLYAVAAWLIMQVAEVLIDLAKLPDQIGPIILGVLAVGFPIALILSWFYEITPEGISLDKDVVPGESIKGVSGRRLEFIVISLLCAAVILFAYDKWWISGPPEQSIAVLPFENMSNDPEQEYFSDGVSEEILNLLAQIKPLKVIARTSSFSFKNKDVDIATMAAQLNVRHILEGSVRRSGDRIRITAQLIDAVDSTHVWSQTYDRELGDIFAVQDEIAAAISEELRLQLRVVAGNPVLPNAFKTANVDAYDAYLRGRELFRRRGDKNVEAAIRHFERALRLDDNFAPAHAHVAIATTMLGIRGVLGLEEVTRIAVPHLDAAQALAPDLAEAHAGRALFADLSGDFESEIEHARKALASNPNYGDAMNWLRIALLKLGRYEEADTFMDQMLTADPLDFVVRYNYAEWLCEMGRIDRARELADQVLAESSRWGNWLHAHVSLFCEGRLAHGLSNALRMQHRFWAMFAFIWVGEYDEARRMNPDESYWVDTAEGNWDEAIRVTQRRLNIAPDSASNTAIAGSVLFEAGRIDEALPLLERALDFVPEGRPIAADLGLRATIWLAEARRKAGDEDGAQAAAQIARRDIGAQRATGRDYPDLRLAEAMLAAFDNDPDRVIGALELAIELGLRNKPSSFEDASFHQLQDEPRFVELQQELDAILAEEHDKVLQLICFNNPVPDDWQPLPETCQGVAEQHRL